MPGAAAGWLSVVIPYVGFGYDRFSSQPLCFNAQAIHECNNVYINVNAYWTFCTELGFVSQLPRSPASPHPSSDH